MDRFRNTSSSVKERQNRNFFGRLRKSEVPEPTLATAKLGQLEESRPKRVALDTKHFCFEF